MYNVIVYYKPEYRASTFNDAIDPDIYKDVTEVSSYGKELFLKWKDKENKLIRSIVIDYNSVWKLDKIKI